MSDQVLRVTLSRNGVQYSTRWFYNFRNKKEAIRRAKASHNLTGKHNVKVSIT